MCSMQTGASPGKRGGKRPRMQKTGDMKRDISDKTLMYKRTESYWGKKKWYQRKDQSSRGCKRFLRQI